MEAVSAGIVETEKVLVGNLKVLKESRGIVSDEE